MVTGEVPSKLQPALEARGLSKRYGRNWALRDLNLAIAGPGVIGLVGPNAAGKSTLIRTWMGFERPTSGGTRVHGLDPRHARRQVLSNVAYVPQAASLYDALTVEEHLTLAEKLRPGFDRGIATKHLEQLRIPTRSRARRLSGGQQAQVALSLAIGTRARVLLLDEPLAHLDPLARGEFLGIVVDAAAEGGTVLLSSHNVSDVERACSAIIVLGIGRVMLNSTIEAALSSHVVVPRGSARSDSIGPIEGRSDGPLSLVRVTSRDSGAGSRPATLEEIVLGYLASARDEEIVQ